MESALAAGVLKQFHSRLAAPSAGPSAVLSTEGSLTCKPQESSNSVSWFSGRNISSSPSLLKSPPPRSYQPVSSTSTTPRSYHSGSGSCAAFGDTMEKPAPLCSPRGKPTTLYDVLGISDMVSDDEIKAAFRRIAKEVHPDQAPPDRVQEYQKKFLEAHEAYSVLKDPQTRSLYNYKIKSSIHRKQFRVEDWRRSQWRGCNWETDQCWTS